MRLKTFSEIVNESKKPKKNKELELLLKGINDVLNEETIEDVTSSFHHIILHYLSIFKKVSKFSTSCDRKQLYIHGTIFNDNLDIIKEVKTTKAYDVSKFLENIKNKINSRL